MGCDRSAPLSVRVGDRAITPLFAGLIPGFVGLYQVNLLLPDNPPTGDQVPVVIESSGQTSQPLALSIR